MPTVVLQDPVNTHLMITRSKVGVVKPKLLLAEFDDALELDLFEPSTYKQATKHAHWRQAMDIEFQAL